MLPREVVESPSPGDIQEPSGHNSEQCALGDPSWAGGLHLMTLDGPVKPQPVCKSMRAASCQHDPKQCYGPDSKRLSQAIAHLQSSTRLYQKKKNTRHSEKIYISFTV